MKETVYAPWNDEKELRRMKIVQCRTNHLESPMGFKIGKPVFSYKVTEAKGKKQTSARIRLSAAVDMTAVVYDTGLSDSINSLAHTADIKLSPRTRYYWDVTVQSDAGEEAVSELNRFETGKQDEKWQAEWITCESSDSRHPIFSTPLTISKPVTQARLYICGLGLYETHIGGVRVGNERLTPYCNDYNEWLQYQTYDVTSLVKDGASIEVMLGNGWYKGRFGFVSKPDSEGYYGSTWKLLAELRVLHPDGSETVIGTDDSWKVSRGNIVFSNIYDGEVRNDTLEPVQTVSASLCEETLPQPTERLSTPVVVCEELTPIALIHTPIGETVLDLGQNITGSFRLKVCEPKGSIIYLQFGEHMQDGNFYRDNLRSAKAEYTYTSDGHEHILEPKFTFYGYRYVKVTGITTLNKEDFTGLILLSTIKIVKYEVPLRSIGFFNFL